MKEKGWDVEKREGVTDEDSREGRWRKGKRRKQDRGERRRGNRKGWRKKRIRGGCWP